MSKSRAYGCPMASVFVLQMSIADVKRTSVECPKTLRTDVRWISTFVLQMSVADLKWTSVECPKTLRTDVRWTSLHLL